MRKPVWRPSVFVWLAALTGVVFWVCVFLACTGCAQIEYEQTVTDPNGVTTETHVKVNTLFKDYKVGEFESTSNPIKAIGAAGIYETKGEQE